MKLEELKESVIKVPEVKVRKQATGYGQLGTKYKKNPKFRDKPREKKVKDY